MGGAATQAVGGGRARGGSERDEVGSGKDPVAAAAAAAIMAKFARGGAARGRGGGGDGGGSGSGDVESLQEQVGGIMAATKRGCGV